METKVYSVEDLKNLFLQELINKVNGKVSKVSDESVLNGVAYGFAKVFQKSMKDVALLESELFPEYAYGEGLDKIARRYGVSERKNRRGSSVFVKIVAEPDSLYLAENCKFISTNGITFVLENDFEVGSNGWGYAKLRSLGTGVDTNVSSNSITKVTGQPAGHLYVTNELPAVGGVSEESDSDFLQRILQNFNNFSFETLGKLTSVYQSINSRVLGVRKLYTNDSGQVVLGVISSNGVSFTEEELSILAERGRSYLSLSDLVSVKDMVGSRESVILQNIDETYLDLDFRIQLDADIDINQFKVDIQSQIIDYLDFRYNSLEKIEWEDIYAMVRNCQGVKMLSESTFYCGDNESWTETIHYDVKVPKTSIPRLRMFVVRSLDGIVLFDNDSEVVPYYYGSDYSNVFNEINNTI